MSGPFGPQGNRRSGRPQGSISRGQLNIPPGPLARFGAVYFDEIVAFTTNGTRLITNGVPTSMVEANGSVVAQPVRLNDNTFKVI